MCRGRACVERESVCVYAGTWNDMTTGIGDEQPHVRGELTDIARNNNFIIKYDKYDWNLDLTRVSRLASTQEGERVSINA